MQTNQWWLRRIRPLWMLGTAVWGYYLFQRYYFFGKNATKSNIRAGKAELLRRASVNKRHFGYGNDYYVPTLERSRKKQILQAMGENYDRGVLCENRWLVQKSLDQVHARIDEENDY